MDVTELSGWVQLGLVVLVTAIRYLFERLVARIFKAVKMESTSIQIFAKSIVMVVFNIVVLFLLGLLTVELFAFTNVAKGLIFVAVGLVGAFLVALLSYFAIKAGYGEGYGALLAKSPIERVLTWATVLVLVGFAEDLFFIGLVQNVLQERIGWGAIVVYVVVFSLYHYANVLSGVEKKEEFLGTLPVRLLVATLLGVSFYSTGSLIYGIIIHNMVDTFSYVALILGARQVEQEKRSA
jgi:membrane protease YdiL (CAAX protease family)